MTRIPNTIGVVSQVITQALTWDSWHWLDATTRDQSVELCHYGMAQRWLVVCSQAALERAEATVTKTRQRAHEAIEKQCFPLQAQRFATPEAAQQALAAVAAAARFGWECRDVPGDTTSRRVWGEYQLAEEQDLPFQVTSGSSKDQRPDLKPCVLSPLCVDRAVPMWGKPEDGHASDKTLTTTLWSAIAQRLARSGVPPGASIDLADAALVTEDHLAALRNPLLIPR